MKGLRQTRQQLEAPTSREPLWTSTRERAVEAARHILSREVPLLTRRYEQWLALQPEERETTRRELQDEIYSITLSDFDDWGLSGAVRSPHFHNSHSEILMAVFGQLGLDSLGFGLDWVPGQERAVESLRFVLRREAPYLLEEYQNWLATPPGDRTGQKREALRANISRITQGHFQVWGLSGVVSSEIFNHSHMGALAALFNDPDLGFVRDTFREYRASVHQYQWKDQGLEVCVYNILRGIRENRPDLIRRYEQWLALPPVEKEAQREVLQNEWYRINQGYFRIWGLGGALTGVPYFEGSYKKALVLAFPDLQLRPLGFQPDWSTRGRAAESVRVALARKIPSLMKRYNDWLALPAEQREERREALKREIARITKGDFKVWGLENGLRRAFNRSREEALMAVFDNSVLNLTIQDFAVERIGGVRPRSDHKLLVKPS